MEQGSTALILGASRGLGLALAEIWCQRGWQVVATARQAAPALEVLRSQFPTQLRIEIADIDDAASISALGDRLDAPLDLLFVNAGIALAKNETASTADESDFLAMMLTNALGAVRAAELLERHVKDSGVLALMSSELGSIAQNGGYWTLYSATKAALNMLMKGFAGRRPNDPRAMLLVAPGWVRTDMGGPEASFSLDESIPLVADLVEAHRGRPGLRFVDRLGNDLPW